MSSKSLALVDYWQLAKYAEFFDYIISFLENNNAVINFLMSTLYTNYDKGEYLYFKVSKNEEIQEIIRKIIIELYENDIVSKAKIKLLVGLLLIELVKNKLYKIKL